MVVLEASWRSYIEKVSNIDLERRKLYHAQRNGETAKGDDSKES